MKIEKKDRSESATENILRITDELVRLVNRTKKMIIVMIFVVVIAIPVTWHVAPLISGSKSSFEAVGYFTVIIAIVFLAIGIRQWFLLSKWTRKYRVFKERQLAIDKELDFDNNNDAKNE